MNATVVGGQNKYNVFDEPGSDENRNPLPPDENGNAQTYDEFGNVVPKNNVFTGVNNAKAGVGPDVREAIQEAAEAKRALMYTR